MRLCVVSCVWQRPERLQGTLQGLAMQTDQDFDLLLINNNKALWGFVMETMGIYPGPSTVIHNVVNRGPYARIEQAFQLRKHYDAFLWVDDDLDFGQSMIATWRAQWRPGTLQGWRGFHFAGDYWKRETAKPGERCSYLWGSNLMVPAEALNDARVLDLDRTYWQCDDLWLCYFANHCLGLELRVADAPVPVQVAVDGKDTYHSQHTIKQDFLDSLRASGWAV